jgi:hypothetical protein
VRLSLWKKYIRPFLFKRRKVNRLLKKNDIHLKNPENRGKRVNDRSRRQRSVDLVFFNPARPAPSIDQDDENFNPPVGCAFTDIPYNLQ